MMTTDEDYNNQQQNQKTTSCGSQTNSSFGAWQRSPFLRNCLQWYYKECCSTTAIALLYYLAACLLSIVCRWGIVVKQLRVQLQQPVSTYGRESCKWGQTKKKWYRISRKRTWRNIRLGREVVGWRMRWRISFTSKTNLWRDNEKRVKLYEQKILRQLSWLIIKFERDWLRLKKFSHYSVICFEEPFILADIFFSVPARGVAATEEAEGQSKEWAFVLWMDGISFCNRMFAAGVGGWPPEVETDQFPRDTDRIIIFGNLSETEWRGGSVRNWRNWKCWLGLVPGWGLLG